MATDAYKAHPPMRRQPALYELTSQVCCAQASGLHLVQRMPVDLIVHAVSALMLYGLSSEVHICPVQDACASVVTPVSAMPVHARALAKLFTAS